MRPESTACPSWTAKQTAAPCPSKMSDSRFCARLPSISICELRFRWLGSLQQVPLHRCILRSLPSVCQEWNSVLPERESSDSFAWERWSASGCFHFSDQRFANRSFALSDLPVLSAFTESSHALPFFKWFPTSDDHGWSSAGSLGFKAGHTREHTCGLKGHSSP